MIIEERKMPWVGRTEKYIATTFFKQPKGNSVTSHSLTKNILAHSFNAYLQNAHSLAHSFANLPAQSLSHGHAQ